MKNEMSANMAVSNGLLVCNVQSRSSSIHPHVPAAMCYMSYHPH